MKTGLACFSFNTNTAPTAPHNKPVAYAHPSDVIQGCLLPCRGKADGTHTRRPMQVCYGTALTDSSLDKTVTSKEHQDHQPCSSIVKYSRGFSVEVVPSEGQCGYSRGQREAEQVAGVGDVERRARGSCSLMKSTW